MSRSARSLGTFTSWLALAFAGPALAGSVTITPLLGVGVNEKQVAGLKQLMASELEFMPEVSGVTENPMGPPVTACLTSTACLSGLVKGTDQLITGSAAMSGANFTLDLLLYDKAANKIVRRKNATVPTDATQLANQITAVLREVITGQGPKEDAATAAPASFDDNEDAGFAPGAAMNAAAADPENMSFDDLEDVEQPADPRAEAAAAAAAAAAKQAETARAAEATRVAGAAETARLAAAAEASRKAATEAAAAETARKAAAAETARLAAAETARQAAAAEAARVAAAAAATRQAEADRVAREAAARAAVPVPVPVDAAAINFGSGVDEMSAEDIDQLIHFGPAPASAPAPVPAPVAVAPRPATPPGLSSFEEQSLEDDLAGHSSAPTADLDTPAPKSARVVAPKPEESKATVERDVAENLQITLRGGYASYSSLSFVAAGGELALPVYEGLHVVGGIQVWAVQRTLPPDLAAQLLRPTEWDTIFPFNFGVLYKFPLGAAQPYLGADAIFAQYYNLPPETDWSIGGRMRLGSDFMITDNFGFNANIALGGWSGKRWDEIETGIKNSGFLPEFTAGTVFAF